MTTFFISYEWFPFNSPFSSVLFYATSALFLRLSCPACLDGLLLRIDIDTPIESIIDECHAMWLYVILIFDIWYYSEVLRRVCFRLCCVNVSNSDDHDFLKSSPLISVDDCCHGGILLIILHFFPLSASTVWLCGSFHVNMVWYYRIYIFILPNFV